MGQVEIIALCMVVHLINNFIRKFVKAGKGVFRLSFVGQNNFHLDAETEGSTLNAGLEQRSRTVELGGDSLHAGLERSSRHPVVWFGSALESPRLVSCAAGYTALLNVMRETGLVDTRSWDGKKIQEGVGMKLASKNAAGKGGRSEES